MNTVARNIKHIREIKRYTQEYMASELGVSQSNYQSIKSGQIKINAERLTQIAKALGVTEEFIHQFSPERMLINNNVKTNNGSTGYVQNYHLAENKELTNQYEDRIREQQTMIADLREMIALLKEQLKLKR